MRISPLSLLSIFLLMTPLALPAKNEPAVEKPAAAPKVKTAYLDKLPKALKPAIFVINTGAVTGTGFVGKLHGKLFLITNLHMIFGAKDIAATNQDGLKLTLGNVFGAADHDIAIIEIKDASVPASLDIVESNLGDEVAVNDAILIPGNSLGGATLLQTGGKVVGLGPRLVEHDAPVYKGNSGSPILSQKGWKVIGVMSYVRKVDENGAWIKDSLLNKDSQIKSSTRFFGFRFDSVKTWYPIDMQTWGRQCAFLTEKKKRIFAVVSFYGNGTNWRSDSEISSGLASCESKMMKLGAGNSRRAEAGNFLGSLQTRVETDTKALTSFEAGCYPYFKDVECNPGDSSARLKAYGAELGGIIKSKNEEIVARIVGRNGK